MQLEILAEKITGCLEKHGLIESDQVEIYMYGMTLLISNTATLLATLLVGFIFHVIDCFLVFLLFFIPLRIFSGGYHSSNYLRCFLTFMLLMISLVAILRNLPEGAVLPTILITSLISLFLIFKFSPVSHPNAPIRESDWFHFKRLSRIICIIEIIFIFFLSLLNGKYTDTKMYLVSSAIGMLYASTLVLAGWIQMFYRKEVT